MTKMVNAAGRIGEVTTFDLTCRDALGNLVNLSQPGVSLSWAISTAFNAPAVATLSIGGGHHCAERGGW